MITISELITLLVEKYPINDEHIDETTRVADIIGRDQKLGAHLYDKFGKRPSISEEQNFVTLEDILMWLND